MTAFSRLVGTSSLALLLALAAALTARAANAHDLGISQSELTLNTNDAHETDALRLHARIVLAVRDLATRENENELDAFAREGLELTTDDGTVCTSTTPLTPKVDQGDGLLFEGDYACPKGALSITATYYFLSKLPAGHRHVATFVAGDATTQRLLTSTSRALTVAVPEALRPRDAAHAMMDLRVTPIATVVGLGLVSVVAALAALLRRRRIVTHSRVTPREP